MIKKKKVWTNFFIIIFLLLIFEDLFILFNSTFSYIDEIVAILIIVFFIINIFIKKSIYVSDLLLIFLVIFIIVFGYYGNISNKIGPANFSIIVDILTIFKFLVIYIFFSKSNYFPIYKINLKTFFFNLSVISLIYVFIVFFIGIANLFLNLNYSYEIRYGIPAYEFIYNAPGILINQMFCMLLIFTSSKVLNKNKIYWNFGIIMSLVIIIMTLRTRGFVFLTIFFIMSFFEGKNSNFRLKIGMVSALVLSFPIGIQQFNNYFIGADTPRSRFVKGAITIIKNNFPFGAGFGNYGSAVAAENYSYFYEKLGFSNYYGMTKDNPFFLHDNYWPMIFGQLGFLGGLFFVILFFIYTIKFIDRIMNEKNKQLKLINISIFISLLLVTIQSSSFAHYSILPITMCSLMSLKLRERGI